MTKYAKIIFSIVRLGRIFYILGMKNYKICKNNS